MNTKQIILSTLVLSVSTIALGMEPDAQIKIEQEKQFKENIAQLDERHASFVKDFETWSKEDQDTMYTYCNGYLLNSKTAEIHKCDKKINLEFDFRSRGRSEYFDQMKPFILAINYLKNKNQ